MAPREQWWVILTTGGHAGGVYSIVNSPSRPKGTLDTHVVAGGFSTREAAQDWITKQSAVHLPDIDLPKIPNPLSGIGAVGHWIGEAVLHLTDSAMWRSIGWLVLGALLVIAGIYLWFRTSATYKDLQSAIVGTVKAL